MVKVVTTIAARADEPEVDERHREGPHLKADSLGVAGLLFFVLSAQAPLTGIAGALPIAIVLGNGVGAPSMYLVAGIVITVFAVGYIAMSRHVVSAGAFYAYVAEGLGRLMGSGAAFVAIIAYGTVQAAMYGLYGITLAGLAKKYLGIDLSWWFWVLLTMAVVQALGIRGIDVGAKVLAVLVGLETSLLLAFDVVQLFSGGGPQGLELGKSFTSSAVTSGAPGVALMFAVASMFGFEATAIYGEEAKDPQKTVPRATYTAVCLIALFFSTTSFLFISHYGSSHAVAHATSVVNAGNSTAFVFGAVSNMLGSWAGKVLPFLLCSSLLAGILAFHNSINRYFFSLSRYRDLPAILSKVNEVGSPWVASILQTATALLLVMPFAVLGKDPVLTLFSWFSGTAVLGIMLIYFLTALSCVVFFRRTRVEPPSWRTLIAPSLASLAIIGVVYVIVVNFKTLIGGSQTTATWLILSIPATFLVGVAVEALRHRGRAEHGATREELDVLVEG